jgi:YHS domain-containing protein
MTQANAAYSVKDWDMKPWDGKSAAEVTGAKLFRVEMSHIYEGDIEGEGIVQYLATQNGFVALEKVIGSVGGRSGSFVFQRTGTFDNGRIKQTLTVIPGSGTGDLRGLSGQVTIEHDQHQESYPITFDYEVREPAKEEMTATKVEDVVCGMEFDPQYGAAKMNYQGETYYFCSSACHEKFMAELERYAKA